LLKKKVEAGKKNKNKWNRNREKIIVAELLATEFNYISHRSRRKHC